MPNLIPNLEPQTLTEIMAIARPIAWGAAAILLEYYNSPEDLTIKHKGKGEGSVTSADLAANDYILKHLQTELGTSEFAYLSEETEDSVDRLSHDWVWIIDPLDGTSDFIKRTGEFVVHIGLTYQKNPVLGLVACPVDDRLYTAIVGQGAYAEQRDGSKQKMQVSTKTNSAEMVAIASRSHRSEVLEFILNRIPKADERAVGSIGGKLGAIAQGRADFYISLSGKSAPKDWDYCAPEVILTEAGGKITHFDRSPLTYNNTDVRQWGNIIATNGHSHEQLCQLCEAALEEFNQSY
ncbi:3'(2'),5'-bisphosphate nucleotidase CysQ family protein [Thalassoporum mexicanum]|nr:3'(2'),5'-bisphosphate nucleotidase CysQ [Pseudanabaena sp. PCC 7367]